MRGREDSIATFIIAVVAFTVLTQTPVFANTGLGMFFMFFPTLPALLMALILVPIILLEAAIFQRHLHSTYGEVVPRVGVANAVSSLVGFPLFWLLLDALQIVSGGRLKVLANTQPSPWLIPYEGELYWLATVVLVGLIPAFFASVFIEGHILKRLFKSAEAATIWELTWKANRVSYLTLASVPVVCLVYSMVSK